MILTKDNLLRYVREQKYTTPTSVAEIFDTTTMIASAALSELAKEKTVGITHLKLSASPYYYDPRQKEALQELGEKHLSNYEKEAYLKLKEQQVLNDTSLSIQIRLAIDRIKDFATPIELEHDSKQFKFWVWYLRDPNETKKQILDVLKGNSKGQVQTQTQKKQETKQQAHSQTKVEKENLPKNTISEVQGEVEKDKEEEFIENYLTQNYLKIENKQKNEKGILYNAILKVGKIKIHFDCFYFSKKVSEVDIISFYTSSNKPKILFIKTPAKKLYKLEETLDNLSIVNV